MGHGLCDIMWLSSGNIPTCDRNKGRDMVGEGKKNGARICGGVRVGVRDGS